MIELPPPVIERHDGMYVVREDLCVPELPSGKLRGVLPWFALLKSKGAEGVVNHATSHSNSHAIVSYAARTVGLKAVCVTNSKLPTEQTELAKSFGGEIRHLGVMRLNVLRSRVEKLDFPETYRRLPWALGCWDALTHVAELVRDIPRVDCHVAAIGGGGYATAIGRGVKRFERAEQVYGVVTSSSLKTNHRRLQAIHPFHNVTIVQCMAAAEETPFPSDATYEHVAWPFARTLVAAGKSVCFWSVGSRLG